MENKEGNQLPSFKVKRGSASGTGKYMPSLKTEPMRTYGKSISYSEAASESISHTHQGLLRILLSSYSG